MIADRAGAPSLREWYALRQGLRNHVEQSMGDKTLRLLMIDDDPADLFFHKIIVEESGLPCEVVTEQEATAALETLRSAAASGTSPPHLIFLDLNMPRMNGWEFLDEYERLPPATRANALIVILSTSMNPADRKRALAHPCVADYFVKPLTEERLRAFVESVR